MAETPKPISENFEKLEHSSSSSSSVIRPSTTSPRDIEAAGDMEKVVIPTSIASDTVATPTVTALDWTGPDDPENPENWPAGKKAYHIAYIGLQCFVT